MNLIASYRNVGSSGKAMAAVLFCCLVLVGWGDAKEEVSSSLIGDRYATSKIEEERLVGEWVNLDKATRSIKRIVINRDEDLYKVVAYGSVGGGTGEGNWGEVPLKFERNRAIALWDHRFADHGVTMILKGRTLIVETSYKYKDNSGRHDHKIIERFGLAK
jgi:hypothetical protein